MGHNWFIPLTMKFAKYQNAITGCFLLIFFNGHLVPAFFINGGFGPNPICIVEHCRDQAIACEQNTECRINLECIIKCGFSNPGCMYKCMNTYENEIYDAMMKCMVDDYGCLDIPPPVPGFRCNPPKTVVKEFSLSKLDGSWYIVRGLNKDYDCFNCQISTYSPSSTSKNYTLTENYDAVMVNGSVRHRETIQQVNQKTPDLGGLLDYTSTMMGLTMYEKWQVLYYDENGQYMIVYYCGHMTKDWWYEGGLVYSRSPVLGPLDVANIASVVKVTMGKTLDQYCSPKTQECNK